MQGRGKGLARAATAVAITAALVFAAGCGGSSSSDSGGSSTTKSTGGSSSGSGDFSDAVVAACSTFKTDTLAAGIDVDAQIDATEAFKLTFAQVGDPTDAEAELQQWVMDRSDWLSKVKTNAATAGKAPTSDRIAGCGVAKEPTQAAGCQEFKDAADSLLAGVQTTPAAAQPEANILLAKSPPADVASAIGVLVAAADGLSGAELSLDREGSADTVRTWAPHHLLTAVPATTP
jgi:hypothetical protein